MSAAFRSDHSAAGLEDRRLELEAGRGPEPEQSREQSRAERSFSTSSVSEWNSSTVVTWNVLFRNER